MERKLLTALWQATFLSWCLSPQGKRGSSHSAWSPYRGHARSPARAPPVISAFTKPSQCLLCAVTPFTGNAFKGQRGCEFTGRSSFLAGPASTESKPTTQKLCTKTKQGTKHKFQVYASSSNSKCVSATSQHTCLVDAASYTLAQLRSGVHFQAYRPGMCFRYNGKTCQA